MNARLLPAAGRYDYQEVKVGVAVYPGQTSQITGRSREFDGLSLLPEESTGAPMPPAIISAGRAGFLLMALGVGGLFCGCWRLLAVKAIIIPLLVHPSVHASISRSFDVARQRQQILLSKTARLPRRGGRVHPVSEAAIQSQPLLDREVVVDRLRLVLLSSDLASRQADAAKVSHDVGAISGIDQEPRREGDPAELSPVVEAALQDIEPTIPASQPDPASIIPAVIPTPRPDIDEPPRDDAEIAPLATAPIPANRPDSSSVVAASVVDPGPRKKRTLLGLLGFSKADDEDDTVSSSGSASLQKQGVAIYDIAASTVYLPNGEKLEAHSGIGPMRDNPSFVDRADKGPTPPHTYSLSLRESPFHGVEAIRLTPVEGEEAVFGRNGLLAHTYMLGKAGDSNGCVVFKDYNRFLTAFKNGEVKQMMVVPRLHKAPSSAYASLLSSKS